MRRGAPAAAGAPLRIRALDGREGGSDRRRAWSAPARPSPSPRQTPTASRPPATPVTRGAGPLARLGRRRGPTSLGSPSRPWLSERHRQRRGGKDPCGRRSTGHVPCASPTPRGNGRISPPARLAETGAMPYRRRRHGRARGAHRALRASSGPTPGGGAVRSGPGQGDRQSAPRFGRRMRSTATGNARRGQSPTTDSSMPTRRSRRATPVAYAASSTAWATAGATRRLKTLGMM